METKDIQIIASGSKANAVLYFGKVLVDCGVSYKKIVPYLPEIELILISHCHNDHYNPVTLKRIALEYPNITIWKCFEESTINLAKRSFGKHICFTPMFLYHDVPNFGFAIEFLEEGKTVFHATDTVHLEGITAKGYDYYCLETNYDEDKIDEIAALQIERSEYCHAAGSKSSHLSLQQAQRFFEENRKADSVFIGLHKSEIYF